MSGLRKQLQQVKADYESARYPGDLATDVFARQATQSRSFWRKAAPYIAAAACVAIVVGTALVRHQDPAKPTVVVNHPAIVAPTTGADDSQLALVPDEVEQLPEASILPSDLPLVPSMGSESIPSPPSLASMDFSSDQTSF